MNPAQFGADISAGVVELRAYAEARMLSTATVLRITDRFAQDESTGLEVPVWDVIYEGPCRIGGANSGSSGTRKVLTVGGDMQLGVRVAHFPIGTVGVTDGDLIDVTAGESAGTTWRVVESDSADQLTALRLPVESVQRPEEWA